MNKKPPNPIRVNIEKKHPASKPLSGRVCVFFALIRSAVSKLSTRKVTIFRWQFNLLLTIFLGIGMIIGSYISLGNLISTIRASSQVSTVVTSDVDFNTGTFINTQVHGAGNEAGIILEGSYEGVDQWYNHDWLLRRKVSFDNSAQTESLANFPALVVLTSSNFNFAQAKSNGEDIRFTDSDGISLLDHEIESWDQTGELAYVYVSVPQIDGASNSDYMYMYYGNSAAPDGQNENGVWNSDFVASYHLNETSGLHIDSTSNGNDATTMTVSGQGTTGGQVGAVDEFTRTDEISIPDSVSLSPTAGVSLSAWFDKEDLGSDGGVMSAAVIDDWTMPGEAKKLENNDTYGVGTAHIGDLDNDGIDDIVVGAPYDDDGGNNKGAVYIQFMNTDGTVKSFQKISSTQGGFSGLINAFDCFGVSVTGIGDLDGDTVEDIAVGADYDDNGGTNKGAVWILFLNTDGTVKAHQKISNTDGGFTGYLRNDDHFGRSVAGIGDLDGDDAEDIVVGAPYDDDEVLNSGAVWVLFLNTNGTVKTYQKISNLSGGFTGVLDNSDLFGMSVSNIGDIDNDGVEDIAVGAYADDDGGTNRGAVWVLFLNTDGTVKAHQKISGTEGGFTGVLRDHDYFGYSVTSIGDLDGDTIEDIAVGASGDDDGTSDGGAVWILFLNTDGTVKTHQKISRVEGGFTGYLYYRNQFGISVTNIGDHDGDGVQDITVGAHWDGDTGDYTGAVWVLFLNTNGTVKAHQKISNSTETFPTGSDIHSLEFTDFFGSSVSNIGDLDNDGVEDVAVGAKNDDDGGTNRGAIWILFLNTDGTVKTSQKISDTEGGFSGVLSDSDYFGDSVTGIGDLDGDTIEDIAVGASGDDDGTSDGGAVWILFLNTDGTVKTHQKISRVEGGFTGYLYYRNQFGISVTNIGDHDGDGIQDIAVGAHWDDDGGADRGAVWVLYLNTNGTVKAHQKISSTTGGFTGILDNSDYFGSSVTNIGDLDNDGVQDIAVGAYGDDDGGTDRGAIWVLLLNTDASVKAHQKISSLEGGFTGTINNSDWFGISVDGIGDLNSDGVEDILAGARYNDTGGSNRGCAWILFLNSDGTVLNKIQVSSDTPSLNELIRDNDYLGSSVSSIGDINNDGVTDLIVGAIAHDKYAGTDTNEGAAFILFMEEGTGSIVQKEGSYGLKLHGNTLEGLINGSTVSTTVTEGYHYATLTYDQATIRLYLDGALASSIPYTFTINDNLNPLKIGGSYKGTIDEITVSSTPRSADWIAARYKAEKNQTGSAFNTFGTEQTTLSDGTWESALTLSDVIDLRWNDAWDNDLITGASFVANVHNVITDKSSILFEMRVSDSLNSLPGIAYTQLGTISSGDGSADTFLVDASTMETHFPVGTGTDRYVQIRITSNSADGVTNPKLDSIVLFYQGDVDDPTSNPTDTAGYYDVAKTSSMTTESWYNSSVPYFEWSGATDPESGIGSYYVYFGTDNTADPEFTGSLVTSAQYENSSGLINGETYYLRIKAVDISGNIINTAYQGFIYNYDNGKPTNPSGLSSSQTYLNNVEDFTVFWPVSGGGSATDDHSNIKGYQYKIGNTGIWYGLSHTGDGNCNDVIPYNQGEYSLDTDFDSLEQGENTFYLRTVDNACNISNSYITVILKYSGNAPTEPQNLTVNPVKSTTNKFRFDWDQPLSFNGRAGNIQYCYSVNILPNAVSCSWTEPGTTELAADAYANLPGENTMYVVAKDEAGNVNYGAYDSVLFTANTPAPGIPVNTEIADISIKASQKWQLNVIWNTPKEIGAGVSYYRVFSAPDGDYSCSEEFDRFTEVGTTTGTSYVHVGLEPQEYSYCVKACDNANNCGAVSQSVNLTPTGRYYEPANQVVAPYVTTVSTRKATLEWVTDRASDSWVQYGLQSETYFDDEVANSDQVTQHRLELTNLEPNTVYYYRTKWTDEDGNTGYSSEKTFRTEPAPVISDVKTQYVSVDSAELKFTSTGADRVNVRFGETTQFPGVQEVLTSTQEATYTVILTGLKDGTTHYYKINPVDTEGYEYDGDVYKFTTPPLPKISNVQAEEVKGANQPTIKVVWESNTEITSVITYKPVEGGEEKDYIDIEKVSGEHIAEISGLQAKTSYELVVSGVDVHGNNAVSDPHIITTAVDSRPPKITSVKSEGTVLGDGTYTENNEVQLVISWNTDEESTSRVMYGEGEIKENNELVYRHVIVILGLEPSSVYKLKIESADSAGNESSVEYRTITPKESDNALGLVIKSLAELFGF